MVERRIELCHAPELPAARLPQNTINK